MGILCSHLTFGTQQTNTLHMKLQAIPSIAIATLLVLTIVTVQSQPKPAITAVAKTTGYAPVNGLKMYYEVYGEGQPLLLIHGSYMSIDLNYSGMIPELAKKYKVITFELQGHGRTADIDRPYSFAGFADDAAGLLKYLNIEKADVIGYSLGATIAVETAIKYPAMVGKLVFISSTYKMDGWSPATRQIFGMIKHEFFEHTPLKTEYVRLAPDTSHWRAFINKLSKFDAEPFDLGADNVKGIKSPVLMITGDNDGLDLNQVADMYKLLGGGVNGDMGGIPKSKLAIIPGKSHVTLMMDTPKLLAYISPFLEGKN